MKDNNEIEDFPPEIVADMLYYQVMQGNSLDITVFEKNNTSDKTQGAFDWARTEEGAQFWNDVIKHQKFDIFFKKYPKDESNR